MVRSDRTRDRTCPCAGAELALSEVKGCPCYEYDDPEVESVNSSLECVGSSSKEKSTVTKAVTVLRAKFEPRRT